MDTMTLTTTDPTITTSRRAGPPDRIQSADAPLRGTSPTSKLCALAAVAGPAVLAVSSLAWLAGAEEARAIASFWAFPLLALAAVGIAARLERWAPRARAILTALTVVGACAGSAFALEAAMVDHFAVERLIDQETPSAILILGLPGTLWPLSLVAIGLLSFRHRTLPRHSAALLALGGILFPLGRIPQIPAMALVTDIVLVAALAPVAVGALRTRSRIG